MLYSLTIAPMLELLNGAELFLQFSKLYLCGFWCADTERKRSESVAARGSVEVRTAQKP